MKVIMSIGNPIKSDDNIGNIVVERLGTDIVKIRAETTPENFLERLKDCTELIIIDALEFGGEPGQVEVFDLENVEDRVLTTHSIPIELFKKFLPNTRIKVVGIQPKSLEFGDKLSKELEEKLDYVIEEVKTLV